MRLGLIGKKCGMTRYFTESGESIPITLVEVLSNRVAQMKEANGARSIQVTAGFRKASKVTKSEAGHFAKAQVEPGSITREFVLSTNELPDIKLGDELSIDIFNEGQKIDVRGQSKGKGFAGAVKRHNFKTQDATHGNSKAHRAPGSIGQCQTPGRVRKGKKMAGRMGGVNSCMQNLQLYKVDQDRKLLFVKGAIPGAPGGYVIISKAVKARGEQ